MTTRCGCYLVCWGYIPKEKDCPFSNYPPWQFIHFTGTQSVLGLIGSTPSTTNKCPGPPWLPYNYKVQCFQQQRLWKLAALTIVMTQVSRKTLFSSYFIWTEPTSLSYGSVVVAKGEVTQLLVGSVQESFISDWMNWCRIRSIVRQTSGNCVATVCSFKNTFVCPLFWLKNKIYISRV